MRENGKTWYRICKMLCEYKKYFPGIICCLLGSSFITFIHPLLIRQITVEQNRCAMACQGCDAVFLFLNKKAVETKS